MSEIRLFYRENNRLKISKDIASLKQISLNNILWIDLNDVPEDAESELEQFLKIYIQEEEEMEEIEISSRYIETEDTLVANSRFLLDNYEEEPISFIVKNNILVSVRSQELRSFNETVKKMFANPAQLSQRLLHFGGAARNPCRIRCRHDRGYDPRNNQTE